MSDDHEPQVRVCPICGLQQETPLGEEAWIRECQQRHEEEDRVMQSMTWIR